MPIYEYEHVDEPAEPCRKRFTLMRDITAPPLEVCPRCLEPIRKVMSRAGSVGPSEADTLSNRRIAEAGMTKYVKKGDGFYVREAGSGGPETIGGQE